MRSSSSSAPDASFASFLVRSLDLLEQEVPWAYAAMCGALGTREVLIEVDGERTAVTSTKSAARVEAAPRAPVVECRTTRSAILDMVDARMTLVDAVLSERVWLCGGVEDLLAFHDGLMTYLGGAVRCPSFPWLLREFRAAASGRRRLREEEVAT